MPCPVVAEELALSLRVVVSEPTVRRQTEAAGVAYAAWQEAEAERLEREAPPAPPGPEKLLLSVDGEWAEVKTLTVGEIEAPVWEQGAWVAHSHQHSYFSRRMEAQQFCRLALVEMHRRGVERAGKVAAVTDGAEWEQGFVNYHRPDATRILDFAHAAERVCGVGQAVFGEGSPQSQAWMRAQLHHLEHNGPLDVLAAIRALSVQQASRSPVLENLAYLEKQADHLNYPQYRQQGLPIGSGAMESGNKVVVEARMKGAGMHWAEAHVNPMFALRNGLCSGRWEEAWSQILLQLQQQANQQRQKRHQQRRTVAVPQPTAGPGVSKPGPEPEIPQHSPRATGQESSLPKTSRPALNHPWRRSPIGKARFLPANHFSKN